MRKPQRLSCQLRNDPLTHKEDRLKHLLWLLRWILKAAIFFTLFAFALNNQQEASVNLFFGLSWQAPLVLIVLAVFTIGLIVGVLAMVPRWWRARKIARSPDRQTQNESEGSPHPNLNTSATTLDASGLGSGSGSAPLSSSKNRTDNTNQNPYQKHRQNTNPVKSDYPSHTAPSPLSAQTLRDTRSPGS